MNVTESPFQSHDHNQGNVHPLITALRTLFIILNSVLIIISNILCILVTKKSMSMEDATKVFTIALAMTDLSIGVVSMSSVIPSAFNMWPFGSFTCQLTSDLFCSQCTLSQIYLSCLGVDRLKAVQKPLQYQEIMSKKRAQITVVTTWFFITTFYIVIVPYSGYVDNIIYEYRNSMVACTFVSRKEDMYALLSGLLMVYFIPVAFVATIYSKLLKVSRAQIQKIRKQIPMGPKPKLQGSILMFTFAMLGSVVAWTPLTFLVLYESFMEQRAPPYVEFIAIWLPISNSWWNVLIYARSNMSWRETCVKMLRKMFKIKTNINEFPF